MSNFARACEMVNLVTPVSAANTAAATSAGVDISKYEGDMLIVQHVGLITAGTLDGKLQVCDDAAGNNPVDISGATFTQVTTSNDNPNVQKFVLPAGSTAKAFIRYVGTIGTGPAVMGVTLIAHPKYTG